MRGKPIGSVVSLYYDSRTPLERDDVIRTPSGKCYRVITNRIQTAGKHAGRQHLRCEVIDPATVTSEDFVCLIHWYPRSR